MENPQFAGIETKIYLIRGHKVLIDFDIAALYGVETRALNQAVRRNGTRFPEDFMFQLTEIEAEFLRSQFVISKPGPGGKRYRPMAFTEYGVAMLSSVLRSERAIQVNIAIMRAFSKVREVLESNRELAKRVFELEARYDDQFKEVFEAIRELISERSVPLKRIIGLSKK